MYDVVAAGELLVDFTPAGFTENGGLLYERNAGGAPANVLAAVARLGGRAAFIGMVGNDSLGRFLADTLEKYRIASDGLRFTDEACTTLAMVSLDARGDRDFMFCRKPGADTLLRPADLPAGMLAETRIFHFGSLSFTDEPSRSAILYAAETAKKAGAVISYDPNYRAPLWAGENEAAKEMRRGLEYADIVKLSGEELRLLTGRSEPEAGAQVLLSQGIGTVLVTLGPKGCFCARRDGSVFLPTYDTAVRDTTGAGDAFTGAFLYRLAASGLQPGELPFVRAAEFADYANAAGALCAAGRGAMAAMPDADAIEHCLRATKKLV